MMPRRPLPLTDFSTMAKYDTNYGSGNQPGSSNEPLFGETKKRSKIINLVVAIGTASMVIITIVLAIINGRINPHKCKLLGQPKDFCVYFNDVIFGLVIILLLVPQVFVVLWYRRGELEPKFRRMIYYNAFVTVLLCIVANIYFFEIGIHIPKPCETPRNTSCT